MKLYLPVVQKQVCSCWTDFICGVIALSCGLVFVSNAVAVDLIVKHRLPAKLAHDAVETAIRTCAVRGFAVSAAVVDVDGALHAVLRGDGAGIQTVQSALDKANTSAVYGMDSGVWVERAAKGEAISPLLNQLPHLLLARGGVVIKIKGEVVGAIAVGGAPGGEIDEACAREGLNTILAVF